MIVSKSTWAEWCPSTCTGTICTPSRTNAELSLSHSPTLLSPLAASSRSLWTSTLTWPLIQEPCSRVNEKKKTNVKHKTHRRTHCTYTWDTPDLQQRLLRPNMWKATCVQAKIPDSLLCMLLSCTSNEKPQTIPVWAESAAEHGKPEVKTESNWFPQSHQTCSWQWELLL